MEGSCLFLSDPFSGCGSVFQRAYRGSNEGSKEGNGLGLYICREIMRKMEGEIFAGQEEDGMSFIWCFRYNGRKCSWLIKKQ